VKPEYQVAAERRYCVRISNKMSNLDPGIMAAIVAAITSVVTVVLGFLLRDRYFLTFKLEQEHKYEQRKALKQILSKNKIQLLNCCESLNFRLWNFSTHYKDKWHDVSGCYDRPKDYYFRSFVYRFVAVFAWVKKIEKEMVYLDTTIATAKDMEFVKFLRLFPQTMCDLILFKEFEYDPNCQKDHFFADYFGQMSESFINGDSVCSVSEYEEHFQELGEGLNHVCRFIDGMSPDEDRLRWDRLQILHIVWMAFINTFGYDFQRTEEDKFKEIISKPRRTKLVANFVEMLEKNQLSKQKEFKWMIGVLNG
jgi:hypothetical protein